MPVKLEGEWDSSINAQDMRKGQLAVIVSWGGDGKGSPCVGNIVQRYGESLVHIGKPRGDCWPNFFARGHQDRCRVRVIPNGRHLIVEDNE